MYQLIVSYSGWEAPTGTISRSRMLTYTDETLIDFFAPADTLRTNKFSPIPALFCTEIEGAGEQLGRIGYINHISSSERDVNFRFPLDPGFAPIPLSHLKTLSAELNIDGFELRNTHWAVKDIDLFKVLYGNAILDVRGPSSFSVADIHNPQANLIALMMPFEAEFNEVNSAIKVSCEKAGFSCQRADDIWINRTIIQDVVSLICKAAIVICDCTGRNPNVFYEIGIAHSLGKEVILITQSGSDIPFDLSHIRYLVYLNNEQGRQTLISDLAKRIKTIAG
jgi:hypothetical protein